MINGYREKAIGAGIFIGFVIATLLITTSRWYTKKTFSTGALNSHKRKRKAIIRTLLLVVIFYLSPTAITKGCRHIQRMTDIRKDMGTEDGYIYI